MQREQGKRLDVGLGGGWNVIWVYKAAISVLGMDSR